MLMELITGTEHVIDDWQNIQYTISNKNDYKRLYEKTVQCESEVCSLCGILLDLSEYNAGILKRNSVEDLEKLIKNADRDLESDRKNSESILIGIVEKSRAKKDLAKSDWMSIVSKDFSSIINTLNMLKWISMNQNMMELYHNIVQLKAKWPINKSDLQLLQEYKTSANAVIKELDLSDEIQEFLTKISLGEATLSDMTQGVSKWLSEKSFDKQIRLNFRSNNGAR